MIRALALRLYRAGLTHRLTADDVARMEVRQYQRDDEGAEPVVVMRRQRRVYGPGGSSPVGAMLALCEVECECVCNDEQVNAWALRNAPASHPLGRNTFSIGPFDLIEGSSPRRWTTDTCQACVFGRVPLVSLATHRDWCRDDDGYYLDGLRAADADYDPGDGRWIREDRDGEYGDWRTSMPDGGQGVSYLSRFAERTRRASSDYDYTGAPPTLRHGKDDSKAVRLPAGKLVLSTGRNIPRP